jgi:hypothetical protein
MLIYINLLLSIKKGLPPTRIKKQEKEKVKNK